MKTIFKFLRKKEPVAPIESKEKPSNSWSTFSTDDIPVNDRAGYWKAAIDRIFQKEPPVAISTAGIAMDAAFKPGLVPSFGLNVPPAQLAWYSSYSFIGYQMAAIISQHWLISKCCLMPAKDAIRNGYDITVNDGTEVSEEVLDEIRKSDIKYDLNSNMVQLVQMGRVFGIRIAMFIVESSDPDYYFKPFNPDGVTPGSYKGITQIDPYWIAPEFDDESSGDPASKYFYEPTWWRINGVRVHRTHLVIFRTQEVPDILKPSYLYGGIPIPQKVYERVYAAERTANEAPMLALTKRTKVLKVDLSQAAANQGGITARLEKFREDQTNYGTQVIGQDDDAMQFDTTLAELDTVIMTQYQIVAAAANVPATKLLGTPPKGFNSTGEFEESSYHQELESIQTHDLSPMLERHHLLVIRSEIAPKHGMQPFNTTVSWKPLDAMTAKEQAEINKMKADTGQVLMMSGAIDGQDERQRIINDPDSGYTGMANEEVLSEPDDEEAQVN